MNNLLDILSSCALFEGIDKKDTDAMLTCLNAKEYSAEKGEFILREGEPAVYVGILLTGSARLINEDYRGNRSIVAHFKSGDVFGESYACAGTKHLPISVLADTDCNYLLIDCNRITFSCTNACSFHSRVIFNLLHLVAAKNLMFNQKVDIISKRSTREKLMTFLFYTARRENSNEFEVPYDRQSLADFLGVDRSGLSSEIGKLRREGIIECEKNHFKLLNTDKNI